MCHKFGYTQGKSKVGKVKMTSKKNEFLIMQNIFLVHYKRNKYIAESFFFIAICVCVCVYVCKNIDFARPPYLLCLF